MVQRYYASNFARFMSPDRYRFSAQSPSDPKQPVSWNRYTYVLGDPISYNDTNGRCASAVGPGGVGTDECDPDPCWDDPWLCEPLVPPPPPAYTVQFQCDISVFATPVPAALGLGYHVIIEATTAAFANGVLISSVSDFFEAEPQLKGSNKECTVAQAAAGVCYLDEISNPPYVSDSIPGPTPPGASFLWNTGFNISTCGNVALLLTLNGIYPNNKFQYNQPQGLIQRSQ